MELAVYVGRNQVAVLERSDAFRHVMTYLPKTLGEYFVSLTMPVRLESWTWPQGLHPFFRQNLPEGPLLTALREQAGSLFDGTDFSLLALVGRNAIGRVRVAPEGADPFALPQVFELRDVLQGDNSETRFLELVRRYAVSGVSGVFPKFLSAAPKPAHGVDFEKASMRLARHIVKGSSNRLPYLSLNEHFTMEVMRRAGLPVAKTEISEDGRVLVVERFDVDASGEPVYGVEDFCGLLGLAPEEKYSATWERIVNTANVYLPADRKRKEFDKLALHILATYVLRDADCHSKNVALYYRTNEDVAFAPVYDMVTVTAYPDYANNGPGMSIEGRKTWIPGKSLERFLLVRLGVPVKRQVEMLEKLGEATVEVSKLVVAAMKSYEDFRDVGKAMLHCWNEGLNSVRDTKSSKASTKLGKTIRDAGLADHQRPKEKKPSLGRSGLLGKRGSI